ncbi:MAG: nucleotidyltransferase domain-containing protein [Terrisporobacter sp.]|uniref:type VII toxin-antitoxin system MntA family adenylyltransferase antitoxin n=1 Tax=Terrisporobacter sp. TaxID=1965305 RepID=UPI002FC82E20
MRNIELKIKNDIVTSILNNIDVKVYAIYIFGSYGTVYEREDSDIDIAIITDSNLSISKKYKLKDILTTTINKEIDLSILYQHDTNLMINVLSQGLLIYESDEYNIKFDEIYENIAFDFYFMETYTEELNKYV